MSRNLFRITPVELVRQKRRKDKARNKFRYTAGKNVSTKTKIMKNDIISNTQTIKQPTSEKKTFATLLIILAIVLMILPFFTAFNDILTRLVMRFEWYHFIQGKVVPVEIKMVAATTSLFGVKAGTLGEYLALEKNGRPFLVEIAWNCIGWQSLIILAASFLTGLLGRYTRTSKFLVVLAGLCGTFLINILRITIVSLFAYFFGQFPAIIFHDYGFIIITILWLIFFWWFSFAYILEPIKSSEPEKVPKLLRELKKKI